MKSKTCWRFLLPVLWAAAVGGQAQSIQLLHSFSPLVSMTNIEGAYPMASLVLVSNALYGATFGGGVSNDGAIFRVNTDGSGYKVLYSFTNGVDGASPQGNLIYLAGALFGTTSDGGASSNGTVYAINLDGTGFTNLHSFTGVNDGANPAAGLVSDGVNLYGTTPNGGNGTGTVFALSADGSSFTNLYSFLTLNDGANPSGPLVLSNNVLYGPTAGGGSHDSGTVFSLGVNGSNYMTQYSFTGGVDGRGPSGSLALADGVVYGTTGSGGTNDEGAVFALTIADSSILTLHSFGTETAGTNSDGAIPASGLILIGNTLFGTALQGGAWANGTVFRLNTDGSAFTNLHSFSSDPFLQNIDGAAPHAGLVAQGNRLYGTAEDGGGYAGAVFGLNADGSQFSTLVLFDPYTTGFFMQVNSDGSQPQGGLALSGGVLYGATASGGEWANGTVFSLQSNGSNFVTLYNFLGSQDGGSPRAALTVAGDTLYGTTTEAGAFYAGTIFSLSTNGGGLTVLHSFAGYTVSNGVFGNSDGAQPQAALLLSGNRLYGTAKMGGTAGNGAVFAVNTDGTDFTNLHNFSATDINGDNLDGANPVAGLALSNNVLYGVAMDGGVAGAGTVFALAADGSGFTNLYSFTNGADGAHPMGTLLITNGMLYGTAAGGGTNGNGTIFALNSDGTGFTNIYRFLGLEGSAPSGGLVGDEVFCPDLSGGANFEGAICSCNLNGDLSMTGTCMPRGASGGQPAGDICVDPNGAEVYCVGSGGAAGNGSLMAVNTCDGSQQLVVTPSLSTIGSPVQIPNGGTGNLGSFGVGTFVEFDLGFGVASGPTTAFVSSGALPGSLAVEKNDTTGTWSISGLCTETGKFSATLYVLNNTCVYFYTVEIEVVAPPVVVNVFGLGGAPIMPGGELVIIGKNFSTANSVFFDCPIPGAPTGIPASSFQVLNDNVMTVTLPATATIGPIEVGNGGGFFNTIPSVVIGPAPNITLTMPAVSGGIFSGVINGPVGAYNIVSSPDLMTWTPASTASVGFGQNAVFGAFPFSLPLLGGLSDGFFGAGLETFSSGCPTLEINLEGEPAHLPVPSGSTFGLAGYHVGDQIDYSVLLYESALASTGFPPSSVALTTTSGLLPSGIILTGNTILGTFMQTGTYTCAFNATLNGCNYTFSIVFTIQ